MPKTLLIIYLIFFSFSLKAQTWEVGGSIGGAGYLGDLNQYNPVKVSGIAAGIFVKRNFDGYWSAKLNYNYGSIAAADSNSSDQQFRNRNLSFTTRLNELSLTAEFNFMEYIPEAGKNKFTPFLYLGLGVLGYNPTTIYQGNKYNLNDYATEGEKKPYSTTAFSIPFGGGIKYNIGGKWTIAADIGYRKPNTDYLDDVSGLYPNTTGSPAITKALADRSGEKTGVFIGTPGTQRGNLDPRDTYFFTQISLSYTFVTQKCYFH